MTLITTPYVRFLQRPAQRHIRIRIGRHPGDVLMERLRNFWQHMKHHELRFVVEKCTRSGHDALAEDSVETVQTGLGGSLGLHFVSDEALPRD